MTPSYEGIFVVIEQLQRNPITQVIPKVAITAIDSHRMQSIALTNGFNDYLVKPITRSDFLMTVSQCIDLREVVHC